jgi:hypothetical protein
MLSVTTFGIQFQIFLKLCFEKIRFRLNVSREQEGAEPTAPAAAKKTGRQTNKGRK